jgi:hypothetical protein
MRCLIFLVFLAFPATAIAASAAPNQAASLPAQSPSVETDGAEIYLYPGSEADISGYGRCAHARNTTSNTIVAFALSRETWPISHSRTNDRGDLVMELTPCK